MNQKRLTDPKCTCRVYACCCCIPLEQGVITIGVVAFLEGVVSLYFNDWINLFLQGVLIIVFLVVLCKRHNEDMAKCLYLTYAFIFVLNVIEFIAYIVVYLVIEDTIA